MASEPRLEWAPGCGGAWSAEISPFELNVTAHDDGWHWHVVTDGHGSNVCGKADMLEAAQLAAEAEALTWLGEAVEALGGRVLTSEQVALSRAALKWAPAAMMAEFPGADPLVIGTQVNALARELGGKHG